MLDEDCLAFAWEGDVCTHWRTPATGNDAVGTSSCYVK